MAQRCIVVVAKMGKRVTDARTYDGDCLQSSLWGMRAEDIRRQNLGDSLAVQAPEMEVGEGDEIDASLGGRVACRSRGDSIDRVASRLLSIINNCGQPSCACHCQITHTSWLHIWHIIGGIVAM